jgi:hypothetical protein
MVLRQVLGQVHERINQMSTKTTNDRMALVDVNHHWKPIDKANPPPSGVKLLLIERRLGIAVISNYRADSTWTHYAGLPTFERGDEKAE